MNLRAAPGRLAWMLNRLRCMPPGEIGYRLRQAGLHTLERRGLLGHRAGTAQALRQHLPLPLGAPPLAPAELAGLLEEAGRILAGEVQLFAAQRCMAGTLPRWNRDPGGTGASRIKYLWELNRHLQLVTLAQAWAASGQRRYLQGLALQLRSWLDQCPPLAGPNWASPLEMGIRLINWSLAWQLQGGHDGALFDGADGARLRRDWLASIHAQQGAIARHLSRHSSANNHLIGELAGLFISAATWPCWRQSARWLVQAQRELESEAIAQFSGDGVNREQAFAYHVFAAEFLFLAGLAGHAGGRPFSPAYWSALQHALRFLRSVRDVGGHVPMVGDADDGVVLRLAGGAGDRAALLLALGAALEQGAAPASPDASVRWLRHAWPGPWPCIAPLAARSGWAFPDGGYLLFGTAWDSPREIKGMLDCGPLGYLGIAAHGHADALAVTLSVGGEPCLVDPGTYTYAPDSPWRAYFRGTSAHNTVRVDGLDQSVSGGPFMWLRKARVAIERMPNGPGIFDFCGAHDGYERLAAPVRHVRALQFDERSLTLTVTDELAGGKGHLFEQFWHFAPALQVTLDGQEVQVAGQRFRLRLAVSGADLALKLINGQENPPLGWISSSYETKMPTNVLKITTIFSSVPIRCRFTIRFSQSVQTPKVFV